MPRTARMLVDGGTYHVLTRGNNGQPVFHEHIDYQRYLQLLATAAKEHQLKVYHFALMPNHVHLVLEAPIGRALSKAMLSLNLTYALFYRRRRGYSGHLWQGRFKSFLIDRDSYLLECGRYVELNPVRAGLVTDPAAYAWSSYRAYTDGMDNPLVSPNPLYETLGTTKADRQRRYRQFVLDGLREHPEARVVRSRLLGANASRLKLEEQFGVRIPKGRRGRPRKPETAPHHGQK